MKKRTAIILTAVVLFIIFVSSSMTYQQQTIVPLLQQYLPDQPFMPLLSSISIHYENEIVSLQTWGYYPFVEFLLRKLAHLLVFAALAVGLFYVILDYETPHWLTFFVAWLSTTGLAAFDEYHQFLTGGRTPAVQDVMIDSSGALIACVICWFITFLHARHQQRKQK